MRLSVFSLAVFAVFVSNRELAAQAPHVDTSAVIGTVQRVFDAMARADSATLRRLLVPGMHLIALATDPGAAAGPRVQTDSAFVQLIAARRQRLLERMWEPVVRLQGPIATVWAPYDFHVDGQWSHCGIDTATLIQTGQGWQIAGLVYTVQRTSCPTSPLGPPQ